MNYRLLSKLLGYLLFLLSGAMFICLAYSYLDHERRPGLDAVESFALSILASVAVGIGLVVAGRHGARELLRKEAVAIVGLGWFVCASFGALPYMLCEPNLGPVQAFFESMSGFTTTGATVIEDLSQFPQGILLWRSLTQWLGGLGILVLFVALLSTLGVGSKALFHHESSAKTSGGLKARIQDVAARLWQIYLFLSILCCAGLMWLGMDAFEAVCHTMTAISTGGFSTRNESVAAFAHPGIELWLTLFMVLGGISFMLYAWLLRGRWDRWRQEEETKCYLAVIFASTLVIAADLVVSQDNYSAIQSLRESLFQVVSIMTTTGYVSADFDQWSPLSRVVLLLLMSIGGCAGSTAGGIKVSRWILFFKIVRVEVVKSFRPNRVFALQLNGNTAEELLKMQTVFFVALAGMTVALGTALVTLLEPGMDMDSCFASVVATLFNIGPGLGAVGPTQNYAHLTVWTQIFLSLLMLLGRLEFFAVLVLFMPSLWRRY